jgi:hypothetical protein
VSFYEDLTPEQTAHIIDRIAEEVTKRELETSAMTFLESVKPLSFVGSQMSMIFVGPFLEIFGGVGIDYIKFFEKRDNVERLVRRIEEQAKVRDEENKRVKEQNKMVAERFGFRLSLLPGYMLQENVRGDPRSGTIGIESRESTEGGFLAVCFTSLERAPSALMNETLAITAHEDMRNALKLSQDTVLSNLAGKNKVGKIRGHQVSMAVCQWSDKMSDKGLIQCFGLWCDKTKRLFVLSMRMRTLMGPKKRNNKAEELRFMVNSLRCH